jgi:hypothetical protein
MSRLLRLPSPGVTLGLLALFVALSGNSYAQHAVSGAVKKITGQQIKDNTIKSRDVKNGSLLAKDFKRGQLPTGPAGVQGPVGPQGPAGPQGPKGESGQVLKAAPEGTTVTGVFGTLQSVPAAGALISSTVTFPYEFTDIATNSDHLVRPGQAAPPECPGTLDEPKAAPGHLCVYEGPGTIGVTPASTVSLADPSRLGSGSLEKGFLVVATADAPRGPARLAGIGGSWAVTTVARDSG